tara:strand:- start:5793 stop:7595 length:1803 start_codon:yes stop_codon:yes gene_type:complete
MLGKFFKKIKDVAGDLSPFAGIAASAFGLGPLYSTLIGAGVPLLAGKGGREALAGGIGGYFGGQTFGKNTLKDVITDEAIRKAAGERFKKAAIFESLGENNPLRNLPGTAAGTAFLYGLGAFDADQAPENIIEDFTYDPAQNKLITSGVSDKFLEDAKEADRIGNNPGDIYEFLRSVGLLNSGGNTMKFDDGKGTVMGMTPTELSRMPTTEETIASANRMAQLEGSEEYEAFLKRLIEKRIKEGKPKPDTFVSDKAGKGNFAMGGGIGALADPNVVGGDRVNPTGGRLVGMGAGREDLLEGEIVDPNTGRTQEILVSNNEHVIPEYTLFALGGGDTEKGQEMMDKLRADTKPMATQMGYDFQGAEDGSMNYNPVMAQDGRQTAMAGPGMNLQEIIKKMMSQGKSIEEIMAIMSKLNMGMPKQRMPMTAQDGTNTGSIGEMLEKMIKRQVTEGKPKEVFGEMADGKPKMLPSIPPTISEEDMKRRFVMEQFGMNPLNDAMVRFFMNDPSGFTKMFGVEEADKIRKSMNMKTQKQMEDEGAVFRKDSAEIMGYNIADGIGTDEINGLKKMGMQEGAGTEFLKSGLGKMVRDLDQANIIASQI